MCQLREHLARIFFPAHCTCMNFFWHDGLVQEFFSYAYALAGYFFSKSPTPPPPSEVEWSAPYHRSIIPNFSGHNLGCHQSTERYDRKLATEKAKKFKISGNTTGIHANNAKERSHVPKTTWRAPEISL